MPHDAHQADESVVPLEVFQTLPKTDLHVHLDGSLRLETILDLARKQGVELPADRRRRARARPSPRRELRLAGRVPQGASTSRSRVMQTEEALERIAYELAEDARRENVRYMEVRYAPMLHTRRGLKLTTRGRGGARGAARAREQTTASRRTSSSAASATSRRESRSRWRSSRSRTRAAASSASTSRAPRTTTRPSTTETAFQLVRDNNINMHHPRRRGLRARVDRAGASTSAARTASATAAGCARTAICSHYVNDHRIPLECCPSSQRADRRRARPRSRTRSSSTSTSACA